MLICKFCNKECKNDNSLRNHERLCRENPNRQISSFVKYNETTEPWNKGLTKFTDDRLMEQTKSLSKAMKRVVTSSDYSGSCSSKYWTEEKRLLKSEEKKKLYKDFPEKHPNRKLAGNRSKMTYPEQIAANWLDKNNITFEHQKYIDGKYVDFCIDNIIVEIDGERFHPIGNETDRIRDEHFISKGYSVFRIRSKEKIEERLKEIFRV